MQTFKRIFVGLLVFAVCISFISIPCVLSYFSLINDSSVVLNDYKKYDGKIDTLFLGSSNTRFSVDVEKYDIAFHTYSYNFSSILMYMPANYYSLCKVLKTNSINKLYLELSYENLFDDPYGSIEPTLNYYDTIENNFDKCSFTLRYSGIKNYLKIYGYLLNNGGSIFVNNQVHNMYLLYKKITTKNQYVEKKEKTKLQEVYKGFSPNKTEKFTEFTYNDFKSCYHMQKRQHSEINIVQKYYLDKIIALCQKNNIDVTFVVYPVTDYYTILYDDNYLIEKALDAIKKEYGYPVLDFNLISEKSKIFIDGEDFYNRDHLSYSGAEKLTDLLINVVKNKDTCMFSESYSSLEENIMSKAQVK